MFAPSRKPPHNIEKVLNVFRNCGIQVNLINADNEFKKLENKASAHVEICAAGQHIPQIEHGIQFMKDRTRYFWVSLPFKKVPKMMVDDLSIDLQSASLF